MPMRADNDPVKLTLDLVGDGWTFRILREAFYGVKRFDGFQSNTGAAPNIVSARLSKLSDAGIFEKVQYSDHARRFEYRLTEKGRALYPLIVLLKQWGETWLADEVGEILPLIHNVCGEVLDARLICKACETEVDARAVSYTPPRNERDSVESA